MDALGKALEGIVKYAWAVFAAASLVLLIPDDTAREAGLYEFRQNANGLLRMLATLAAAFALAPVLADAKHSAPAVLLKGWQDWKKRRRALARAFKSLSADERMWFKYCLYYNTNTLTAEWNHPVVRSLYRKGLVEEGTGHILDLPFHIPEEAWRYLLAHRREFIGESEMRDEDFPRLLQNFRKSLRSI